MMKKAVKRINSEVPWRSFEQVVARIEAGLYESSAVVKTPDRIRDLQTGTFREVDVSIRSKVGSAQFLVTIECRRRGAVQDVIWIEQLATKKRRIGANATIAVAANGFSSGAVEIAKQEGIDLRTLKELSEMDFLSWLNLTNADLMLQEVEIKDIAMELYDPSDDDVIIIDEGLAQGEQAFLASYPFFVHIPTGVRYAVTRVMDMAQEQGHDPFDGCKEASSREGTLTWENYDRGIGVDTNHGLKSVKKIFIKYLASITKSQVPISQKYRYEEVNKGLLEGAEFDLSSALNGAVLTLNKDLATGAIRVGIQVQNTAADNVEEKTNDLSNPQTKKHR